MTIFGYARVSTKDQDLALQKRALQEAGCTKIFYEKASGARSDRPKLALLIKSLCPDDEVVVTRLDRLARSTLDLLMTLDRIGKAGARFRSIADTWCDTGTAHGKLLLAVLGSLAEFERTLIMERTQAGLARARQNGVAFGRKVKLNPQQRRIIAERYAKGDVTMLNLAHEFKVGEATIWRVLRSQP